MLTKAELKIIDGGADIRDNPARPGDKAFAPRLLALTTFPHRQPQGNPEAWTRHNGRITLTVRPGWDEVKGERLPYPSGSIPRLLTVYLCREAKRADAKGDKSGRIELGRKNDGLERRPCFWSQQSPPQTSVRNNQALNETF